jgi:hypothetical protein
MIYIGIDNGLSGGIVALSPAPGVIIDLAIMPTRGKAKGNEVDSLSLASWLAQLRQHGFELTVILETPGKFAKGVQAISSMWDSYGATRSVLECGGFRHHRIAPQTWQKRMLVGCQKGDTKPAALARCRQLWPAQEWTATARSTKPHEGLIDAALIAEFGRIQNL